jgi:hypothetical protein
VSAARATAATPPTPIAITTSHRMVT